VTEEPLTAPDLQTCLYNRSVQMWVRGHGLYFLFHLARAGPGRNAPLIYLLISALYTLFACLLAFLTYCLSFSLMFPYLYLLPYLAVSLRIGPLCFQAGCRKRRQNLALVFFAFIFCCSTFVLIGECVLLLC